MAAGVTALLRAFFGCGAFRGCRAEFLLRDPFERKFDPAAIVGRPTGPPSEGANCWTICLPAARSRASS